MKNQTVYKLPSKTIGDWELPIKDAFFKKIVDGVDTGSFKAKYVKGAKSIWADELPEHLPSEKVWFNNGFLFVPNSDKNLLKICELHPFLNLKFFKFDKEEEAKKELAALKAKDDVIELISNSDTDKIVATAMAVFGQQAFSWDISTSELELRKYAEQNPQKLSNELNSKTYESKYLSALAFGKGIVRNNLGKTAVIWNDSTEGEILKLARGENGIAKLGELLSKKTEESELILQAIGEKIKSTSMNLPKKDVAKTIKDKDAEIEALKKQLAEAQKGGVQPSTSGDSELAELQAKYKEIEGKEVPPRFKNDKEWIAKKIEEATTNE